MKKETAITAVVFLGVGFLAGYAYRAHETATAASMETSPSIQSSPEARTAIDPSDSKNQNPASSPSSSPVAPTAGSAASAGLPPGHPPIDAETRIKFLEDEAARQPHDPMPRLRLANFFYDQRQFEKAIEWYHKTLELDPGNISARTDMGTSYLSLGQAQEAIREYHKSLQLDPKHQPTLFNLVVANLEGTHDLHAARLAWNELHQLNPNYPGLNELKENLNATRK